MLAEAAELATKGFYIPKDKAKQCLLDLITLSRFDRPQNLIHLFVGGSELHGAKVGKTDDTDLYGVYIEDPERALPWFCR